MLCSFEVSWSNLANPLVHCSARSCKLCSSSFRPVAGTRFVSLQLNLRHCLIKGREDWKRGAERFGRCCCQLESTRASTLHRLSGLNNTTATELFFLHSCATEQAPFYAFLENVLALMRVLILIKILAADYNLRHTWLFTLLLWRAVLYISHITAQ